MKLNEKLYAVVKGDGTIAGDGEAMILESRHDEAQELAVADWIIKLNGGGPLRVAEVRIVEVRPADANAGRLSGDVLSNLEENCTGIPWAMSLLAEVRTSRAASGKDGAP